MFLDPFLDALASLSERYTIPLTVIFIYLAYLAVHGFWSASSIDAPSRLISHLRSLLSNDRAKSSKHKSQNNTSAARAIIATNNKAGPLGLLHWASKKRHSDAPPGLGNLDNSCYQNSVLQSLSALDSLKTYLAATSQRLPSDKPHATTTTNALYNLLRDLSDPTNNGRRIWTPSALKSMSSWQQQDAQEYYCKIVDELSKDCKQLRAVHDEGPVGLSLVDRLGNATLNAQTHARGLSLDSTIVDNPLQGMLGQRVACIDCGYCEGLSLLPFNCITVPLGRARTSYDISECLDSYVGVEEISGVQCPFCTLQSAKSKLDKLLSRALAKTEDESKHDSASDDLEIELTGRLQRVQRALDEQDFEDKTLTSACMIPQKAWVSSTKTRQAVIARAPRALVIHINRSIFDEHIWQQRKNYARVTYPKHLDLSAWMLGQQETDSDLEEWIMDAAKSMAPGGHIAAADKTQMYELRAVAIHKGEHEDGHYVCYRQHPVTAPTAATESDQKEEQRRWWELSDDDIASVSEESALSQGQAFLLFYEKTEVGWSPCGQKEE